MKRKRKIRRELIASLLALSMALASWWTHTSHFSEVTGLVIESKFFGSQNVALELVALFCVAMILKTLKKERNNA